MELQGHLRVLLMVSEEEKTSGQYLMLVAGNCIQSKNVPIIQGGIFRAGTALTHIHLLTRLLCIQHLSHILPRKALELAAISSNLEFQIYALGA